MGVGWLTPLGLTQRGDTFLKTLWWRQKIAVSLGPSATRCFLNVPIRLSNAQDCRHASCTARLLVGASGSAGPQRLPPRYRAEGTSPLRGSPWKGGLCGTPRVRRRPRAEPWSPRCARRTDSGTASRSGRAIRGGSVGVGARAHAGALSCRRIIGWPRCLPSEEILEKTACVWGFTAFHSEIGTPAGRVDFLTCMPNSSTGYRRPRASVTKPRAFGRPGVPGSAAAGSNAASAPCVSLEAAGPDF